MISFWDKIFKKMHLGVKDLDLAHKNIFMNAVAHENDFKNDGMKKEFYDK